MICAPYKELVIPENLRNSGWKKALEWLKADSWKDIPMGKTEIDGAKIYAIRSTYSSKPLKECRYESHRVYADIQMLIKGTELIQVCFREELKVIELYSAEKDIDFLEGESKPIHSIVLSFPLAAVFFPWDAHMPCIAMDDKPDEVEKIIVKVAL